MFFSRKTCRKYEAETIPIPFSQKSNLNISEDQQSEILYSLLLMHFQVKDYQNILKLQSRPLAFTA